MYPLVEPRQRPERFLLNRFSPLAESAAFLGLGGFDAAGSVWYPDARRLLGAVPNDGTLTNMDPPTDWVWVPELGRWSVNHGTLATSNKYVTLTTSASLAPTTGLSAAAWIRFPAGGQLDDLGGIIWGPSSSSNSSYILIARTTEYVNWYLRVGAAWVAIASDAALSVEEWHHVCGTWDGATTRLYVDGVAQTATGSAASINYGTITAAATLGRYAADRELQGHSSDHLIYNRPLSPAEIETLANRADPMLGGWIVPPHRMSFPAAVAEAIPSGSGTLDATGTIEGTGWRASEASGTIEAAAAIVGVGYAMADGAGTLGAVAEIVAVGYRVSEGIGTLDAVAAITGTGYTVAEGTGTLDAVAEIIGVGEAPLIVPTGSGSIVGVAEIEGTGYRTSSGHASLDAVGSILATGYASHIGSGVIEAVAIMAGVGRTPLETINTPASRTRTVRAEDRTRIVRREDRTLVA